MLADEIKAGEPILKECLAVAKSMELLEIEDSFRVNLYRPSYSEVHQKVHQKVHQRD